MRALSIRKSKKSKKSIVPLISRKKLRGRNLNLEKEWKLGLFGLFGLQPNIEGTTQ